MNRTWIKFCGFTRPQDLQHACELQVDAVGLVLVPKSSRYLELEQARMLIEDIVAPTRSVLLFLNPSQGQVEQAVETLEPDLLQFHGTEPADFCAGFGIPWMKALSQSVAADQMGRYPGAFKLLIDSHQPGGLGGTGETIDPVRFPGDSDGSRWLIAGGLNPANVAASVAQLRPFGVDVSSGIETSPGIKDRLKMTDFVEQVRHADGL